MLCKKFNVDAVWPVHSVRPSLPSSKLLHKGQKQPVGQRNMLLIKGKKGDVEEAMKELNTIAQGLFEKRVQVPSTIPLPVLLLEKEENASRFNVVITIIKAKTATSTSDDISDNDSDDDEDTAQNQSLHTVVVVGNDFAVVSTACNVMSGPYVIENPNYTPQQFGLLFKELVQQNTKKNFQSENTVFVTLEKISTSK